LTPRPYGRVTLSISVDPSLHALSIYRSYPPICLSVTETPAGISAPPLRYRHIPLSGAPVSAHGRAACHPIARVCVPLDAAVTRVTCTCPARRGCHSCDVEPDTCIYRSYLPICLSIYPSFNTKPTSKRKYPGVMVLSAPK